MDENLTAWNRLREAVLSTEQVRAVDRLAVEKYGMNSLVLMENAAIGCVHWLLKKFSRPQTTAILCGRGNNGGDGLAIARHLTNCGWPCRVLLMGPIDSLSQDAMANFQILTRGDGLDVRVFDGAADDILRQQLKRSNLVVDALLGTGAKGDPRSPIDSWIRAANDVEAFRVAIDVPSGVNAETGACGTPTFRADATLTFVAKKPGMVGSDARSVFGELQVLPIGVPAQLMREVME